jgi:crotonobetainyl-CoA:carnitine CoA-transferase CaiB-like acyl-CoA transferase
MGRPELPADPRFTPRQNLLANHEAIHAIIREWVAARSLAEAQQALDRHGVPASKVYQVSDIVADDHYAAREQVVSVPSEVYGSLLQPGVVPRLTATPGAIRGPAPALGEHNREIYGGLLGFSDRELEDLAARGII